MEKIFLKKNPFLALFLAKMGCDRRRKREKNFETRLPFILNPGMKIPKKIEKKNQKIKKPIYGIIFSQNGMR